MSVEETVKETLLDTLDVDESEITPIAHLRKDLGASSVDLVEILALLENDFDIDIPDEDGPKLLTVQAIIDYVKAKTI